MGCAPEDFNFQDTLIDFIFLSPELAEMTQGRIKSMLFSPHEIIDVQYVMCRMTPLTDLSLGFIKFCHNGSGKIYFYGIEIYDVTSQISFYFPVNKYVSNDMVKHALVPDMPGKGQKSLASEKVVPVTPVPQMSPNETCVLLYFIIVMVSFSCQWTLKKYCSPLKSCRTCDYERMIQVIVYGTSSGLVIECMTIIIFLFIFKKIELKRKLVKGIKNSNFSSIFLIITTVAGAVISSYISYASLSDTYMDTGCWLITTFFLVIILSVWKLMRTMTVLKRLLKRKPKDYKSKSYSLNVAEPVQSSESEIKSNLEIRSNMKSEIIEAKLSDLDSLLSELDKTVSEKQPKISMDLNKNK